MRGWAADFAAFVSATQAADAKICLWPPRSNRSAPNCAVISARLTRTPAITRARQKNFNWRKNWIRTTRPRGFIPRCSISKDNQINDAIRDLEKSEELNDNRSVYRSQLLLDQDRAVRSANLAAMYRDAGMFDVSVREAARAVNYDYANYSAHLFLANSYDELRDPNEINLRYETPAESEYLVANLLAPVGAGPLSPTISQQEYSKLFERDGFGVASDTEYLSRGAWTESGAQFGTFGNFSYDFESFYRSDPGQADEQRH